MARPPAPSRPTTNRPASRGPSNPITKEPAHLPLHRRLLFPTVPLAKPLPLLVQGDGANVSLLNERIYNLIALAFRAFLLSWLPRVTKDRSLLPQIHHNVLAPILLPIFAKIQANPENLTTFLLIDLPSLLNLHLQTYWQSRRTALIPIGTTSPHLQDIYHAHLPLISTERTTSTEDPEPGRAPIPEGQYVVSGLWLTALSESIIKLYLPPDEYKVVVERVMIREIIGRTILGNVARKIGEPWFWWSLLPRFLPIASPVDISRVRKTERSVLQNVMDWAARVWKLVLGLWSFGEWFFATLSVTLHTGLDGSTIAWMVLVRTLLGIDGRAGCGKRRWTSRLVWGTIEMIVFLLAPILDRLLPHLIRSHILTPGVALRIVDLLEKILFPLDGYPAPTPPDPGPEEIQAMRRQVEEQLSQVIPPIAKEVFMPFHLDLRHLLDPISDSGCNAHLVAMLYTSLVGTLIPELVVKESEGAASFDLTDNGGSRM